MTMPGLTVGKIFVAQPLGVQLARLKTFDHDVGRFDQFAKRRTAGVAVEIDHLALLAGVQMGEGRAQLGAVCRSDERRQIAHRIAAGRFDLDHFHAQVGKHAAA